jgi:hypothetical protein
MGYAPAMLVLVQLVWRKGDDVTLCIGCDMWGPASFLEGRKELCEGASQSVGGSDTDLGLGILGDAGGYFTRYSGTDGEKAAGEHAMERLIALR